MKQCEKCCSQEIKKDSVAFEDLHNIMEVFICLSCGYKKSRLVNIQEELVDA